MDFKFNYNNINGVYSRSFFLGKDKLSINGSIVQKTGKYWTLTDGTKIETALDHYLFPKLLINNQEIKLVNLTTVEYIFTLLPMFLIFWGGAVPVFLGFLGCYINLAIFLDKKLGKTLKILSSLGVFILFLIIILVIASAFHKQ